MGGTTGGFRFDGDPESPTVALDTPRRVRPQLRWHGGADLGLLILRLGLAAVFIGHGAQKTFGLFGGPGIGGFADYLAANGFRQTTLLAWLTGLTELAGGGLLLVGMATPLAAAGLLGVMVNVVWLKLATGFFLSAAGGFEFELVLGCAAAALVLAGGGRVALDRVLPLFRRPAVAAAPCLVIGVGAAVAVRLLLHG